MHTCARVHAHMKTSICIHTRAMNESQARPLDEMFKLASKNYVLKEYFS